MSKKDYLRKKTALPKTKPVKVSGSEAVKASGPDSFLSATEIVLQDPDLKSYSDRITIDGRVVNRVCKDGILRTKDLGLAQFMKSKGYL